jgi:dephospho-CoA kinase
VVHEVPLLLEAGLDDRYDLVLVVTAGEQLRRERAGARFARARRQLDDAERARRADVLVPNEGTLAELDERVGALLEQLEAGQPPSPPA